MVNFYNLTRKLHLKRAIKRRINPLYIHILGEYSYPNELIECQIHHTLFLFWYIENFYRWFSIKYPLFPRGISQKGDNNGK